MSLPGILLLIGLFRLPFAVAAQSVAYLNREVRAFKKTLQTERYDLVIDAQLIKSGIISRMSRGLTIGEQSHYPHPGDSVLQQEIFGAVGRPAVDRIRQLFSRV